MGEWGCLGHGVHWDTAILSYLFFFVCVCFRSNQQRGHLETAPPFTVPCQARNQPKIMGGAQSKILDLLRQF